MTQTHPLLQGSTVDEQDPTDEDNEELENDNPDTEDTDSGEEDEPLGPKGESALRKLREEKRELKRQLRDLKQKQESNTDDEVRESIRQEMAQEYGVQLAREKAVNLLINAGYRGNPERGSKLLDVAEAVENGKVNKEALSELIDEWKSDDPALFKRSPSRNTVDEDDDTVETRSPNLDLGQRSSRKTRDVDPLEAALASFSGNTAR